MGEKIMIEFSGVEFDEIQRYMDFVGATTLQDAILNAIKIAFDNADQ